MFLFTKNINLYAFTKIINTYFIQSNVAGEGDKKYEVIDSFVKYLQKNKSVDFNVIQKDIKYLVDSGSKVVDYIGKGKDNLVLIMILK